MVFLFNLIWSLFKGKPAGGNPWRATTLEWQTPRPRRARQLGQGAAGGLSLGLRLQRARRRAGFHAAEPAARRIAGRLGGRAVSAHHPLHSVRRRDRRWWLSQQRLTAKPWLEEGPIGEFRGAAHRPSRPKIGLGVFLAVVGSLFALFISAYSMRMGMVDWRPLPPPKLLWVNTGVLILSSVALQWAQVAARRGDIDGVIEIGLLAGGASASRSSPGSSWRGSS
jgi:hypothetical protein